MCYTTVGNTDKTDKTSIDDDDDDDGCGMAVITVSKYSVQLFQNNQCMALNVSENGNIMTPPPPHTHTQLKWSNYSLHRAPHIPC